MFSLALQELSPYAAPLLVGTVALAAAVQQFMRAQKTQQQLADSEEALLAAREQLHEQAIELQVLGSQQQQLQAHLERREADYQQLKVEHNASQTQLLHVRGMADAARAAYRELKEQQVRRDSDLTEQQARYLELQQVHQQLQQDHRALSSLSAQKEQHLLEQQQLLKDSREQLKLEFEQLATQIFEARGQSLTQSSQQSLEAMLKPFREQIDGFRQKVEDIHHKDAQQQASLQQQLLQLKELNQQITHEAHELSSALRGQKKAQGNWGELILENVLERAGLQLGKDFAREVSFSTSEGRKRPDAIVYLPQNKHLIIDAKVSLNAYLRYVNADDEALRAQALNEHVSAFSARVSELAERDYAALPGLNSPDMVFMFVPIESAFADAMRADDGLLQRAIEQNILIATPSTLLASLTIVRQLWRFEEQSRSTAELAERAAKVYDKLRIFLGSMDGIGNSLDRAQEAYRKACDQLVNGRGNLLKQASDFQQLGVAVKTEIDEQWQDRARLELTHLDDSDSVN
ncbi:DNA recombination protein RmuC [Pseudomonas sp. C27(2019)]|uniref:DNA recombination protein RmuC n=1 Tax=Pseudomonas sp. C27(2019) TaxID=2604941 RepID=UPI00124413C4|nr:DNA recombination protein RmuC [Pseudomonas sp. C27(2019)]QEY58510.1 DNA recombination protein RmuC [Pseudomonas sp. C27(2019)]